jgi:hypothetical protein
VQLIEQRNISRTPKAFLKQSSINLVFNNPKEAEQDDENTEQKLIQLEPITQRSEYYQGIEPKRSLDDALKDSQPSNQKQTKAIVEEDAKEAIEAKKK